MVVNPFSSTVPFVVENMVVKLGKGIQKPLCLKIFASCSARKVVLLIGWTAATAPWLVSSLRFSVICEASSSISSCVWFGLVRIQFAWRVSSSGKCRLVGLASGISATSGCRSIISHWAGSRETVATENLMVSRSVVMVRFEMSS